MSDESENYLCIDCVGDSQLKSEIDTNGSLNSCFHCEQQKMCIDIEELADRVDEVYRKHYRPSETPVFDKDDGDSIKWKHAGDHPEYIIAEMIEADIGIGQKIADILSDRYRYQVLHDGDDDYYDTTDTYESTPIDTYEYSQIWKDFCEQIKHKSRFFSPRNLDALDLIFDKITEYKTDQGIKPIREIGPDDFAFRHIYRAREASDEQTILKINEDPSKELGVPPVKKAKASRMNYAGIPVLYASFDPDTCVAEMAVYCIRKRNIQLHKQWMIRSYILTFAFVTFRIFTDYLPYEAWWGVSRAEMSNAIIWGVWVLPLIAYEIYVQSREV